MPQVDAVGTRAKKEIDHIRVHKSKNGGHILEHHFTHFSHMPERHAFGPGEHKKMISHLAKQLNLPHTEEEREEEHV